MSSLTSPLLSLDAEIHALGIDENSRSATGKIHKVRTSSYETSIGIDVAHDRSFRLAKSKAGCTEVSTNDYSVAN